MKKIYITLLLLLIAFTESFAGQDAQAKAVLDKTAAAYKSTGGICLTFNGSQEGTLWLRGECFYLKCAGIKSWFDGKTQWSYVEKNDEVTVTNPTGEEIRSINPYSWITSYQTAFDYRYNGTRTFNGKQGHEIILTPKEKGDIQSIILGVSDNYQPLHITIRQSNGQKQVFNVTSYKTYKNVSMESFRFNPKKYPTAEVIDMR